MHHPHPAARPHNRLARQPLRSVAVALAAASLSMALASARSASWSEAGCATVEVQNVRPQQGRLMLAAYLNADTFGQRADRSLVLPAGEATMRFELCGLSGATVALTLYQDLDSNGKMGTSLIGIPNEPWGASGSPGMMGPSWDTARVPLDGSPIVVRMSR